MERLLFLFWGSVARKSAAKTQRPTKAQRAPVAVKSHAAVSQERRNFVYDLVRSGKDEKQIVAETRQIVNPRTKQPYSPQTIKADIKLANKSVKAQMRPVAETIGDWTYTKPLWNARILLNVDSVYRDYVFFDHLRRGYAPGYEIGGLFCLPIAQTIASYSFADGISAELIDTATSLKQEYTFSLNEDGKPTQNKKQAAATAGRSQGKPSPTANGKPRQGSVNTAPQPLDLAKPNPNAADPISYTNAQIKLMMERMQGFIQQEMVETLCLGNQYVVVNPDTTFSVISPETVTVEYSASDYRYPLKYIIRTKMEKARVEDVYEADKRTLTIHYYDNRGVVVQEFENLIGRIPIVHLVCDRSANEIYGRPVYEAALPIMRRYDDLIYKMVEGAELLSNPIPVFEGLDNPGETKQLNSDAVTYQDSEGITQTEYITRFDRNTGLYIGKGGSAKMLAPPVGFTKDTLDPLRQLFLLLLNHTRIPEFLWGGAIASSKASAETQLPPFIQYIRYRRLQMEGEGANPALGLEARGGLLELIDIWLRTYKLLNPTIVVGPVRVNWPEIDIRDSQIKQLWGTYLNSTGQLTTEDTIALTGYWDDPAAVAARATGQKRRPPKFDDYDAKLNRARLEAAQRSLEPPAIDAYGPPYSTDWATPSWEAGMPDGEGHTVEDAPYEVAGPLYWAGIGGRVS